MGWMSVCQQGVFNFGSLPARPRNPQVPRLKRTWSRVREWVEGTGIQFWYNSARKPDGTAASQIGNSCGIVAARVTTLLRDRPNTEDLYEYPTTSATEFQ